ncbi:MAG: T9SS type A sorting domain-containing protein [candidate division WOR-3 bacterium]
MKILISIIIVCKIVINYAQTNDFMVNEETYQAHWVKDLVSASRDNSGNFVFVWYDMRSGAGIYAQRVGSDGNPIGVNFKVNEDSIFNIAVRRPDVGCDSSGKFVVIYEAGVTIYVRRFSQSGAPFGPSFRIADTCRYGNPAIAVSRSGNFVVTWSDTNKIIQKRRIFARLYDKHGQPIDTTFEVSDSGITPNFPDISYDRNGNFAIIWADIGTGSKNIYGQIFDSLGNRIGANFIINDSGRLYWTHRKDFSFCHLNNNFVVTWNGQRGTSGITGSARLFYLNGQPIGSSFRVNDTSELAHPSVSSYGIGNFVIVWKKPNGSGDIYGQKFDSLGNRIGNNFMVNDTSSRITMKKPDKPTVIGNNDRFIVAWRRRCLPFYHNIVFQVYDRNGVPQGNNRLLSDDKGYAYQLGHSIAIGPDKRFFITWTDTRNKWLDVYGKLFDSLGNPLTEDFKVNSDTFFNNNNKSSSIAGNGRRFIIIWEDDADTFNYPGYAIFGQRFDLNGNPLGEHFIAASGHLPEISASLTKKFVYTYLRPFPNVGIYTRRLDSLGNIIGNEISVSDTCDNNAYPSVTCGPDGRFVVCWNTFNYYIYAQMFDSSGNRIGGNFIVNDTALRILRKSPQIAFDRTGNFIVVWADERKFEHSVYGQRFNADGVRIGGNFRVNDDVIQALRASPSVVCRNAHEFFICWQDERMGGSDLWGQYYLNAIPVGRNRVINQSIFNYYCETPALDADSENIYITWAVLKRYPYNYDVYAKVIRWSDLVQVEEKSQYRITDQRFKVFPNPAYKEIKLQIPGGGNKDIELKIYDTAGRLVRIFSFPTHLLPSNMVWDGRDNRGNDIESGVYFVQLKVGDQTHYHKVILIK